LEIREGATAIYGLSQFRYRMLDITMIHSCRGRRTRHLIDAKALQKRLRR
jgi:hypothetical protein